MTRSDYPTLWSLMVPICTLSSLILGILRDLKDKTVLDSEGLVSRQWLLRLNILCLTGVILNSKFESSGL